MAMSGLRGGIYEKQARGRSGLDAPSALTGHMKNAHQVYRCMCAKIVTVMTVIDEIQSTGPFAPSLWAFYPECGGKKPTKCFLQNKCLFIYYHDLFL